MVLDSMGRGKNVIVGGDGKRGPRALGGVPLDHATLHGVNLSGWLVPESWVTPSLFSSTGTFDERGLFSALSHDRFEDLIHNHRSTFITERDFQQIALRGYNAVRLPVPWHVFGSEGPMAGSWSGCIDYVDLAFDWAEASGIQILLDMAVVPGGSTAPDGQRLALDPEFKFRGEVLEVLAKLAARYADRSALLGIEPLEEPVAQRRTLLSVTPGIPIHQLRNFYRDAYERIRDACGPDKAVVLSAAGMPGAFRSFMAQDRYQNVWLDLHLYHYNDLADATGAAGVRSLVARSVKAIDEARRSSMPVIVGEWSAALPVGASTLTPEGRIAMERVYTSAQIQAFRATSGWFFQTWKTESKLTSWDARVSLSSFERGMFD